MISRFSSVQFYPALDSTQNDIWGSSAKNMRFNLPYDQTFTVTTEWESNLPGIADYVLGDMNLWWVLLEYNGLNDPIEDIKSGTVLKVPRRKDLIAFLERSPASTPTTFSI